MKAEKFRANVQGFSVNTTSTRAEITGVRTRPANPERGMTVSVKFVAPKGQTTYYDDFGPTVSGQPNVKGDGKRHKMEIVGVVVEKDFPYERATDRRYLSVPLNQVLKTTPSDNTKTAKIDLGALPGWDRAFQRMLDDRVREVDVGVKVRIDGDKDKEAVMWTTVYETGTWQPLPVRRLGRGPL